MIEALLWDVDGTLAETERDGHRLAFNDAFASMGMAWTWDVVRYGELLRITGGRERILADLATQPDAPVLQSARETLARELHRRKNLAYERRLAEGSITLRRGVLELLDEARARDLTMAIVTTTSRSNVDALLAHTLGPGALARFSAVICGEDVTAKKPDPEAYRLALTRLSLRARDTLAIEDSPAGVAAACGAGVPVIVARSAYFAGDPANGALAVGPGLHTRDGWRPALVPGSVPRVTLDDLIAWHARTGLAAENR